MPKKTFFNLPDEKREKIISSAMEEFSLKGYSKTSVNSITRKAGIAKGSIYQYFEDKKDFYLYLVSLVRDSYMERRTEFVGEPEKTPFKEVLRRTILFFNYYSEEKPSYVRFYFSMINDTNIQFLDEIISIMTAPSIKYISNIVKLAKKRGEIKKGLSENQIVFALISIITSFQKSSVDPYEAKCLGLDLSTKNRLLKSARELIEIVADGICT